MTVFFLFFQRFIYLFYVHWCFACIYVYGRVSGPLELELQTVVSCHCGSWELNLSPLEEQPVLLVTEKSLQPHAAFLKKRFLYLDLRVRVFLCMRI